MKDVFVRPARDSDINTLVAYSIALAQETEGRILNPTILREGICALLQSSELGFFIVAESTDPEHRCIVGQLMITYEWSDWRNGSFWWVQSVYVDPAWRRQGVYWNMYRYIRGQAQSQPNTCGLRLYVEANNQTAQAAYQKAGLSPAGYLIYQDDFLYNHTPVTSEMPSPKEAQ